MVQFLLLYSDSMTIFDLHFDFGITIGISTFSFPAVYMKLERLRPKQNQRIYESKKAATIAESYP